ncbi:hypothetical protein M408DRAFT_329673 [Serendipita vermifera MAFF 305830]|uniref:F-box domain-containing protein n=1 Tax=Serendipita vermifera MAFF 305830 TaxID=933852 RepID=A0A0C3B775_SERVB|nr:hypothetical protein M408DRAFT_329673 [Serendipita vermifera MAFF 305830]
MSLEQRSNPDAVTDMGILQLPTELLLLILRDVDSIPAFIALTHTSKRLRILALPYLYRNVDVLSELLVNKHPILSFGALKRIKILKSLCRPEIAGLVTNIRITLSMVICNNHAYRKRIAVMDQGCHCDSLDNTVSSALQAAINLKSLDFFCFLHPSGGKDRHSWISNLQTRSLCSLTFSCECGVDTHTPLFVTPALNSVEAVRFHSSSILDRSRSVLKRKLEDPNVLPNLRTLYYEGTVIHYAIVASRPIRRIAIPGHSRRNGKIYELFTKKPGTLTHIAVEDLPGLAFVVSRSPSSFTNLRHIGMTHAPDLHNQTDLIKMMGPFQVLPHLSSIYVTLRVWILQPLLKLRHLHRNLRTVSCPAWSGCFIWHLKGDTWKRTQVDSFEAWDIIRDTRNYDKI